MGASESTRVSAFSGVHPVCLSRAWTFITNVPFECGVENTEVFRRCVLRRLSTVTSPPVCGGVFFRSVFLFWTVHGLEMRAKSLKNRPYTLHMPRKHFSCVWVPGHVACFRAQVLASRTARFSRNYLIAHILYDLL